MVITSKLFNVWNFLNGLAYAASVKKKSSSVEHNTRTKTARLTVKPEGETRTTNRNKENPALVLIAESVTRSYTNMDSGSESVCSATNDLPNIECDACKFQNKSLDAISYCADCSEYLCAPCDMAHRGLKATRNHKLLSGDQVRIAPSRKNQSALILFCDNHSTMVLDAYCKTHGVVICRSCEITDHNACNTVDVKDQAVLMEAESDFINMSDRLIQLRVRYENLNKQRHEDTSVLKMHSNTCLQQIRKLRKDVNDHFDVLEQKMSGKVQDVEQTISKEIAEHMIIIDDALCQIQKNADLTAKCQRTFNKNALFVRLKKVSQHLSKYEHILSNIEADIEMGIEFTPNIAVKKIFQGLQLFGTISTKPKTCDSILGASIIDYKHIDVGSRSLKGCTFMSDGCLVLTCSDDTVKLMDRDFQLRSTLGISAVDVVAINDTDVIATRGRKGGHKQLHYIQVLPDMVEKRKLKTRRYCFGIDYHANQIFVTCHNDPGEGEIHVLDMEGHLVRNIALDRGVLWLPGRVKVNTAGDRLFVSDEQQNKVTCLGLYGHVHYECSDSHLKLPVGMYVDGTDNLLVCSDETIHCVSIDGKRQDFLDGMGVIKDAVCLSYRPSDGVIVVGLYEHQFALLRVNTRCLNTEA